MIRADGVTVRIGGRILLDRVHLSVEAGRLTALVGPNGAGKSTLLAVLAGDRRPDSGTVVLDGRPLPSWRQRELALRRAVMLQDAGLDFGFTAGEVVALGRLPHGGLRPEEDRDALAAAADMAAVRDLWTKPYPALSGGERQRVQLARALAQVWSPGLDPRLLLLDEPTSALDLRHQWATLALARDLARRGWAVLAVLHDLNLAAMADHVALLNGGVLAAAGTPAEVLTPETVGGVYGIAVERVATASGLSWLSPLPPGAAG
ncbi:heme ABC transporter ATP-binding protein [Arenibaculum pallidiluteum]|uniref:heme ABC transporter ATP-binding protein n=1 Tax=Arenibaculum pallidiluteum TaxID=2812559 RepID=UPI001A97C69F|nr:heme ABC transporter ATP-binding protein [Arenibaculum pallidiluteum]